MVRFKYFLLTVFLSLLSLLLLISTAHSNPVEKIDWIELEIKNSSLLYETKINGLNLEIYELSLMNSFDNLLDSCEKNHAFIHAVDSDLFIFPEDSHQSESLLITDYERFLKDKKLKLKAYLSILKPSVIVGRVPQKNYLPDQLELLFTNEMNNKQIYIYEIKGEKGLMQYLDKLAKEGWFETYKKTLPNKEISTWQKKINKSNENLFLSKIRLKNRDYLSVSRIVN
ncbi:hypothetical protein [Taylorella equigenitalis]|uniref:Exported protein n=1 Tax=Taylorella equigenitalis ATCC 35865 TaxID=743973 RepID=A0ABN4AZH3_9BURK|nr:hypothetical protein [Taylorella equigenitalis]AFN35976.1 putative exported protein [Taylorella equigenitalis ATCC 35865]ASY40075.1 hypothetical protein CA604_04500 [Taylorella equigenitalis]WDU51221.1 hypothetical protein KNO32_04370 [Taylorella equigenitalis]VEG31500.1 Uncharacterised protein [Taylorella equigenitalis ATCC 35865]